MKAEELVRQYKTGKRNFRYANLRGANLSGADLIRGNLCGANLSEADLHLADLRGADLRTANLYGADLRGANLSEAKLTGTVLGEAVLTSACLSGADLREVNLSEAYLAGATLTKADLRKADLGGANLRSADLRTANLYGADLRWANLSGAKGLLDPAVWLQEQFESDAEGLIVFKAIGDTYYTAPDYWTIEPGAVLKEVCNLTHTSDCACGVNFATPDWIQRNYANQDVTVWRCRIEWMDLAGVVVPYNTDGKARCARLRLLEKV